MVMAMAMAPPLCLTFNTLSILPTKPPLNPTNKVTTTLGPPQFPLITTALNISKKPSRHCSRLKLSSKKVGVVCASGYNVQLLVEDNESDESLVRKFRFRVLKAGVIQECKRRMFFENKQEEKKCKACGAAKRNRRRHFFPRSYSSSKQEESDKRKDDDDEDNWELPEGELPY